MYCWGCIKGPVVICKYSTTQRALSVITEGGNKVLTDKCSYNLIGKKLVLRPTQEAVS